MEPTLEQIFGSYMAWKIDEMTWVINFMNGSQNLYLLEGENKALLIDTGYGAGNLRAFVEKLTNKQIIVANTHYHPDHSAGNGEFEEVFMSAGSVVDAPAVDGNPFIPFDIRKLPHPDYAKRFAGEGDVLDIGGRKIEILDVKPAHCNSSLFFLDRGHRMFFCGDELEAAQVMMFDNSKNPDAPYDVRERLENMKANMQRVLSLSEEFDYLLPNHNGAPIAKSYARDFAGLADHIFAGDAVIEDRLNNPFVERDPVAGELCRVRYNKASIFIKKADVLTVYGK